MIDLLLALVDQTFGGTNLYIPTILIENFNDVSNWNYLLHKQEVVTDAKIYAWNSYK